MNDKSKIIPSAVGGMGKVLDGNNSLKTSIFPVVLRLKPGLRNLSALVLAACRFHLVKNPV